MLQDGFLHFLCLIIFLLAAVFSSFLPLFRPLGSGSAFQMNRWTIECGSKRIRIQNTAAKKARMLRTNWVLRTVVECCGFGMFYPGSGSQLFSIPDPGSGSKHFFIPDPGSYINYLFFLLLLVLGTSFQSKINNSSWIQGVKSTGSRIPDPYLQHCCSANVLI
jgi:hypothetical protein